MTLRRALSETLPLADGAFREQFSAVADEYDLSAPNTNTDVDVDVNGETPFPVRPPRTSLETELVRRLHLLDDVRLGLTLSGPAYEDNPIVYANRTVQELTGYAQKELNGRNPRLLQGPATEAEPVADLREALAIWEPVTVTLTNYRADGTRFRNRVSLIPVADDTGAVTNWVGIQDAV